jgi:hypothetical protein
MVAIVIVPGLRINRLIAVEGQRLSWQDAELMVDGQRSHWQPDGLAGEGEMVVPAKHVYILPDDLVPAHLRATVGYDLGMVPVNSVHGVVSWRTYPLSRFARFQ